MYPTLPQNDPFGLSGQVLAQKYEVHRLFAEGGFSLVYRGMHRIWKRPIAIKVLKTHGAPADVAAAMRETFLREGAFLAELSSESTAIVQAWDVGTHTTPEGEWLPYMVLEWLDGEPLEQLLAREGGRPWALAEVMRLLGPVAHALELAHMRGIAHRDIKPDNLFLIGGARDGSVKILDFGVAKVMESKAVRAALATTGGTVRSFTPAYGAPEQFSSSYGATGPWTDVYALALVMVELLSGRRPLIGEEIVDLARSSMDPVQRPVPSTRGAIVPHRVEQVFTQALAVSPGARFASAGEFWAALQAAQLAESAGTLPPAPTGNVVSSQPPMAPVEVVTAPARRGMMWLAVATALLGALLFAVAFFSYRGHEAPGALASSRLSGSPALASIAERFRCPEGMARIPGGQFYMGSDAEDALDGEKPSHQVKLRPFCIDLTEVTTRAYQACSDSGKCKRASTSVRWPNITDRQRELYGPICNLNDPARADHPINCVDWSMAVRFCSVKGGRLPTEAEWEYATRGPDGRVYPWGDEDPTEKHLNACGKECVSWGKRNDEPVSLLFPGDDGFANTAPVGRYPAGSSRFGPMDVVGNVWEWVADWYGPYNAAEKSMPTGPTNGERRVIRGGAWNGSEKSWLRPSFRYAQDPTAFSHGIGFRCAMDLPH
jgi:formylglycine-generating enzyme required for sulfatase activity